MLWLGTIFSGGFNPHSVLYECLMQKEGVCVEQWSSLRCFWTSVELQGREEDDAFRFWTQTQKLVSMLVCWQKENYRQWPELIFYCEVFLRRGRNNRCHEASGFKWQKPDGRFVASDPHDCCDEICWSVFCVFWWGFVVFAGKANICCFCCHYFFFFF